MELTIFLAQLFGLYTIIGGVAIMLRESYYIPVLGAFVKEPLTRLVIALLEVLGGLMLVLLHTNWSSTPAIIITVCGWAVLLEGIFYMLASDKTVEKLVSVCNVKTWYFFGGMISIVLGAYLAGFGFGLF
jgi:predicted phage tail protein